MAKQVIENKSDEKKEETLLAELDLLAELENVNIDPVQIWYGSGGWLPGPIKIGFWRERLIEKININDKLAPSVQALADLIKNDPSTNKLANQMITQSKSLNPIFAIQTIDVFLHGINLIIQNPIIWTPKGLIGIPLAAWFAGVDATLAGQTLFRYPSWNKCIKNILDAFNSYLNTQESWPTKDNSM